MARPALYNTILLCPSVHSLLSESEIWESPSLRTDRRWSSNCVRSVVRAQMTLQYLHSSVITRPLSSQICPTHPPTKQHGGFQHCPSIIHKCNYFLHNVKASGRDGWTEKCGQQQANNYNIFEIHNHKIQRTHWK